METFQISYRLVYYPSGRDKEFYAIERIARITESNIEFV
jgi:hypothetical protein